MEAILGSEAVYLILRYGLKYGPTIAKDIASLFSGEPVTVAQVLSVLNKAEKSADDYIAEARSNIPSVATFPGPVKTLTDP